MYEVAYQDHRKLILDAAEKVIRQFGFEKTTMNDIARAMRKAKSSLYHYFTSKEQIFAEVLRSEIGELKAEFVKVIDAESTMKGKIRSYVTLRMEMFRRMAKRHMAFIEATSERYDLLLKIHEEYDEEEVRIISGIFREGVETGEFTIADPLTTATAFVTALKAFEYPFAKAASSAATGKEMDFLLDILFNGIVTR